jgi:hypothetical protein
LRTETTFNDIFDFGVGRRLSDLSYLRTIGDHNNGRVLEPESLAHDCGLSHAQRGLGPADPRRGPARAGAQFGQPRVTALLNARSATSSGRPMASPMPTYVPASRR